MAGELGRVRTIWTGAGVGGALSTHYFGPNMGTHTLAERQACIDRVRDFWVAMQTHMQIGVTFVVDGNMDFIAEADGTLIGSAAATSRTAQGTLTGDPLPYQTQGLVRWNTATIADGHRLRGHTYIPTPMESENTSGSPVAAYVTALNTAGAALLVNGSFNLCIWHRPIESGKPHGPRVGSSGLVTGAVGQGSWSVLRSRRT